MRFALALALLAPVAAAQEWPTLATARVFGGLPAVSHIAHAGDGSGRLFVVQQSGRILVSSFGTVNTATPFLDIADRVSCCGERGLLSVAFPPAFVSKRHFYVDYTNRSGNTVVSRFRVSASNADVADAASEEILLTIPQPYANHNGGQLAFARDGTLYIGMGDGGSSGDPQNNAQSPQSLLGKVLRIDVESGAAGYVIPPSNPFYGSSVFRNEIWAYGLRNPWRFSFDRETADLYIADVGQNAWEEIDFQGAASRGGENYGWRVLEGTHCYNAATCSAAGTVAPVAEYSHAEGGCSVTGGFVYRGRRFPRLTGIYFYADYCTGRIWGLRRVNGQWLSSMLLKTSLKPTTFGEDEAGEIYLADEVTASVYRLVDALGATSDQLVPIVLDVPGQGGTRFTSELTLTNRGTTAASLLLTYTAASSLSASGSGPAGETLGAGRQMVIPDALAYLRQKGVPIPTAGNQGGTLRVVFSGLSSRDAGSVSARTTTPSGSGRAGLSYGALKAEELFTDRALLFGLRETDADRTNVALVNAGTDGAVSLRVTVYPGDGSGAGTVVSTLDLAPGQWAQLDGVLRGPGLSSGWASVERLSGAAPFYAYAVFNDNRTGDGSFASGVPAGRPVTQQIVPSLVDTATFQTELVLANPNAEPVTVTLRADGRFTETLRAREQRIIPRAVDYVRSRGGLGATAVSPLVVESFRTDTGQTVDGFAGARTAAAAPGGGQYGVFYAAVPYDEARNDVWVIGLRQEAGVRSNLALAGTDPSASFRVQLFDGATGQPSAPILVESGSTTTGLLFRQLDSVLAAGQGYARIQRVKGGGSFLVYGVVNDGSTPTSGATNDGSYLGMSAGD